MRRAYYSKLDFIHLGYGALSINALGFDSLPRIFQCRLFDPILKKSKLLNLEDLFRQAFQPFRNG